MNAIRTGLIAIAAFALLGAPAQARGHHHGSDSDYYTNVSGHRVHRPEFRHHRPAGASAHCADGSWSFSEHRSGTCSHHGGVAEWE